MPEDISTDRPLFGGAISSTFPVRFQDVSNIRQVPDHQEVFADPSRDESLVFELLDLKPDINDNGSAVWFLQDLANEQDAQGFTLVDQSGWLRFPLGILQLFLQQRLGRWGFPKDDKEGKPRMLCGFIWPIFDLRMLGLMFSLWLMSPF
ncbi:hypothetical protein POPTR_019G023800v4 [Populus trichocarpa]|uniref:Uncharacterized protein n=1 Tax=Populus trichocarpa TaxID=3694 RepID=A0ACC0RJA1_POPTR|nr:hypothetical protein POPTR_019G023800v4 [Populus trichocarpa]